MSKCLNVSVVVLNWNGTRDTVQCLSSLSRANYPYYEVIVVDNGSHGEERKNLKSQISRLKTQLGRVRLILNTRNLGFAEGNNIAIRQILQNNQSDFVLLLNNDTVVERNFLVELVKAAQAEKEVGVLGPKIYYYNYQGKKNVIQSAGSNVNLYLGKFPSVEYLNKVDSSLVDRPVRVDFVIGACLLIRTAVIKKIGLLDSRFFTLFEDTDWCLRAKRAGYSVIYVPQSVIWHKVSRSFRGLSQVYFYTRNLFWFELKNANFFQLVCFWFHYFSLVFPGYFLGYLLAKRDCGLWKKYLQGVRDGILGSPLFIAPRIYPGIFKGFFKA